MASVQHPPDAIAGFVIQYRAADNLFKNRLTNSEKNMTEQTITLDVPPGYEIIEAEVCSTDIEYFGREVDK
jgi:predicted phage tail protein